MNPIKSLKVAASWRKRFLWAGVAVVVYSCIGFFLLPAILKWQLLKQLPDISKRNVAIKQVRMNPWTFSTTIRGLALTESNGQLFASWDEFYVNFQLSSLFRWAWTFKEISLVKPFGHIVLDTNGKLNFANMLPPPETNTQQKPTEGSTVPRVNIFQLQVTNGFLVLEDQTRRSVFRTEYRPINFNLDNFTTRPGSDTPYSFHAESDAGRSLTWAGDVSVQPLASAGSLKVTGMILPKYRPYLEEFTTAVITNGTADIDLSYSCAANTNGVDLAVTNGSVRVRNFQIQDSTNAEDVFGFSSFAIDGASIDLKTRNASVDSINLDGTSLLCRLNQNGLLNLLEMLTLREAPSETTPPASPASQPWTLAVNEFTLTNANVTFEDLTRPSAFKTQLHPISLNVKSFTTEADEEGSYSFSLATESSETISGNGAFSVNPVQSSGEVTLSGILLPKYGPYVPNAFRGKIAGGKLDVRVPYKVALGTNDLQASISNMVVQLADLALKAPEADETVVAVPSFKMEQVAASLQEHAGRIGKISTEGASVLVRLDQSGAINLFGLLLSDTNTVQSTAKGGSTAAPASPEGQAQPWKVYIEELDLRNYTVKLEDQQPAIPASFLLDQLNLNVKGISTDKTAEILHTLSLRINETGTVRVDGKAQVEPLSVEANISVADLDLKAVQPYVNEVATLELSSGRLGTTGRAAFNGSESAQPLVSFVGDLSVDDFKTLDLSTTNDFAGWQKLSLSGIDAEVGPNKLKIAEIKWVSPKANLALNEERKPNVALILKQDTAKGSADLDPQGVRPMPVETPTTPTSDAMHIEVGTVVLENAELSFKDASVQPRAEVGIQKVSGTIKGLSSANNTTADVNLSGTVGEQSPFVVAGRLNPLAPQMFMDLVISNSNTQLAPLTPYTEKYAGHPLMKGRLSTKLHYQLQGTQLQSQNKIQIEQLTLGPKNNSPNAISAPVKLGVALLKDSSGTIKLDVPVSGRLDDPEFRVGPIIMQVIVNMIVKAAASPFKLLGAVVGGGEELSFVDFSPGGEAIAETESAKLEKLAKALSERPALNLEIEGNIDPAADRMALGRQKIKKQLRSKRLEELTAERKNQVDPETFTLSDEDYSQLLRSAFAEQFGTNISAVLQTNAALLATASNTNVSKAKRSFPKRVLGVFGFGGPHRSPAEKGLSKADRQLLAQATPEAMETLLATNVYIEDEEYRELMTARAREVQKWLKDNGNVAADRLLLVPPRAVGTDYKGEARVTLALN